MPTPIYINGLEHNVAITGAAVTPTGDRIWTTATTTGGTPAIDTTVPKHGLRCLEIPTGTGAESSLSKTISGSPAIGVASFYIRFKGGLPSADCRLFHFQPASGSFPFLKFLASDSTLRASFGSSNGDGGTVVAADTWYLIDYIADVSTGTRTVKIRVNGGTEHTDSLSAAASTFSQFQIGRNTDTTTATGNILYDDIVISVTSADYPMGEHEVQKIIPDSDGTHSFTNNDFIQGDAGSGFANSATNIHTFIDDGTIDGHSTTDSVQQNVIRTTGYIEINFEAGPRTVDAWGIQISGGFDADATGACTSGMRLWDGTTEVTLYGPTNGDVSNLGPPNGFLSYCRATNPSGGAWTQSAVDGIRMRWGFSGDVTGSPIMQAAIIEVAYPIAAAHSLAYRPDPLHAMIGR